jgi:hypothetical protein
LREVGFFEDENEKRFPNFGFPAVQVSANRLGLPLLRRAKRGFGYAERPVALQIVIKALMAVLDLEGRARLLLLVGDAFQ